MSNYVAFESKIDYKTRKMSGKRRAEDEGDEDGGVILEIPPAENLTTLTTACTVPATTDQFMHTPEFRRHFFDFIHVQALMALRVATKVWKAVAEEVIDEGMKSAELMVHAGNNISYQGKQDRSERRKLVTRVVFFLNITKIGRYACYDARNLVVVNIPEGVESIGQCAFSYCSSLTTVSFPTTLASIGQTAFCFCSSLYNVDLRHTNLQELRGHAFSSCSELK
ncbi:hypothetical protein TrLO_g95 [Triparma laevis f. longispina]|uniref:Uncharacterized protein n=1 Tax=Triparma laevis f. longispina TaxID=1714387 RepID=A0A9W7FAN6_9STRA|nr:hypothetical protein TrLO_g95 [Triparma laevis f. longispina]